jgi:putative SOS response-associated peptidase YedK
MCGRFTQLYSWPELVALYRLTMPPVNLQPSYNICPTDPVDVVLPQEGGGLDFVRMRWGLVPYWWSKPLKQVPATFNARSDTVATKPMFRDAFKRRRCVIPMSGFYEWRQMADGKQPFFISGADAPVHSVAGLWDNWKNRETGETIRSCTMIVTEANPLRERPHYDRRIHVRVRGRLLLVIDQRRQPPGGARLSCKNGSSTRLRKNTRRSRDALRTWWTARVQIPLTNRAGSRISPA